MAHRHKIHWFQFGLVERGRSYRLTTAYCEVTPTGYLVPPSTKREAQTASKERGGKAVFHESEHLARQAAIQETRPCLD